MVSEIVVHLNWTDVNEPVFGWCSIDDGRGEYRWLADVDFGPFLTAQEVGRWVARVVRDTSMPLAR